jgi:hypothetical protein
MIHENFGHNPTFSVKLRIINRIIMPNESDSLQSHCFLVDFLPETWFVGQGNYQQMNTLPSLVMK